MNEPQKTRVLYFDESADTMASFIELCGNKGNAEIVGAFSSFAKMAPLLIMNNYKLLLSLSPDVLVVRAESTGTDICPLLRCIRRNGRVRLVGILCGACADDRNLMNSLDYYVCSESRRGLLTDESLCFRLLYQIKTARLMLNTEKYGVNGKWAVLPLPSEAANWRHRPYTVIAIGASAGGTEAVTEVLCGLPADIPPILLVQHLPENFSNFFARNLAAKVAQRVCVARGGEKLEPGNVYIAGYDKHMEIVRSDTGEFFAKCTLSDKVSGHRPSVDVLFRSVAKAAGAAAIGVILTGMGSDGAQGLLEMHESGAYTIGQDKETSTVYGMPMVAYTLGAVAKQLPLNAIAKAILKAVAQDERREKQ